MPPNGPPHPYALPGKWSGMVSGGNIDLFTRPKVKNPRGGYSTVDSISVGVGGNEVLIPTVIPHPRTGKFYVATPQAAVSHYRRTGEHLGEFKSPAAANTYARALHQQQASFYGSR